MEYYLSFKKSKKEILPSETIWIGLITISNQRRTNTIGFHVSKILKLIEAENGIVILRGCRGGRSGKLLIKKLQVLIMQDEYVLEICCTTLCL